MKKILTKKRIIWGVIIIIVLGGIAFRILRPKPQIFKETYTVAKQDVKQTVISTGTVTSETDLDLSFKSSGVLTKLNVKVGDKVKEDKVLAMLDEKDALASIAQANASVLAAQANLDKVLNGTSDPDVAIAQTTYDNAYAALLNSTPQAIPDDNNSSATVAIHGTYTGTQEGSYTIKFYNATGGTAYEVSGLGNEQGIIDRGLDEPIGQGLYINFSDDGDIETNTVYTVTIPNTLASDYLTNYNAFKAAEANLNQKKAMARPEDVNAAKASLASAKATLQIAQNTYDNNIIKAPTDGQITSIDFKIGEQVTALKPGITLLNPGELHVESDVPESSIGLLQAGQRIDMTLDAFGPDRHLDGEVLSIDPASTVISGVIEFRVISSLPQEEDIKPGMTVNLNIIISDQPETLAIPNRLITTVGSKKTVSVLRDGKAVDVEIQTGATGDNYTQVTSGLAEGDVIVSLAK